MDKARQRCMLLVGFYFGVDEMEITKAFLLIIGGLTAWMIIMSGAFHLLEWCFSIAGVNTGETGFVLIAGMVSLGVSAAVMADIMLKFDTNK